MDGPPLQDPTAIQRALAHVGIDASSLTTLHADDAGTIFRFDVDAEQAVATRTKIRALTDETGLYPIVIRDEDGSLATVPAGYGASVGDVLARAATFDVAQWFVERQGEDEDAAIQGDDDEEPAGETPSGWVVPIDTLTGKPAPGVAIALIPTRTPWEVFAYLRLGGWNECPDAVAHVAAHRRWFEEYGAELVCLSNDIVEMSVPRPPTARDEALALACEHYAYCFDVIDQGYETLRALASHLAGAEYWFFWWD